MYITASDALSNETKLSTADTITVEQDAILTLNAGHASQLGERLKTNFAGQGQVSITDYDGLTDSTTDLTNINTASIVVAATSNADISRPNFSNNLTSITIAAPEAGEFATISASDADHFGNAFPSD